MNDAANPTQSVAGSASPLQMLRIDIDLVAFHHWAYRRRLASRHILDEGFALHCLLVESFGLLAPKPFRLITPRHKRTDHGVLYGYGCKDAEEMKESAVLYADPLQLKALSGGSIASKPMPVMWRPKRQLGFEVRIRPTRRRARGNKSPGTEHDAFQIEAMRYPENGMPRSREAVYIDWLAEQFEKRGGAQLESAAMESFQRTKAIRKLRQRPIEGPTAVMRGVISITEGEAFAALLASGIGRHRAYGYGMILLRPITASF